MMKLPDGDTASAAAALLLTIAQGLLGTLKLEETFQLEVFRLGVFKLEVFQFLPLNCFSDAGEAYTLPALPTTATRTYRCILKQRM